MNQDKYRNTLIFFIILFLLTLTNSIFLNQIGYYGALTVLLVKLALTKRNPFFKTGLEIAFVLFLSVEIVSLLLSEYQGNAFNNFLKRALLIPLVYVFSTVPESEKDVKRIIVIYLLAASSVTTLYVWHSVEYFLQNLYRTTESGPSIFQYPITSSELYSFLVVLLFAFLFYGKLSLKLKITTGVLFLIAGASLFATYKMTGWIGAGAGIFLILIYKRDWKIILPLTALGIVLFFLDKDISTVERYELRDSTFVKTGEVQTGGRAYDLLLSNDEILLADFNTGIQKVTDKLQLSQLIETPSPVVTAQQIDSTSMLLWLMDSRFLVMEKRETEYVLQYEVLSPGLTNAFTLAGRHLYIMDKDSGLSVFKLGEDSATLVSHKKDFPFAQRMVVSNKALIHFDSQSGLAITRLVDGNPAEVIFSDSTVHGIEMLTASGDDVLISEGGKTSKYFYNDSVKGLSLLANYSRAEHSYYFSKSGESELFLSQNGAVMLFSKGDTLPMASLLLPYSPNSAVFNDNSLYVTYMKRSKLLRIVDPFHPSNFARIEMWKIGWRIFKDYPVFGVGDISLEPYYREKKSPYLKEIQGHLHNNYVHVLAILGGAGFLIFMYLLGVVYMRLHRAVVRTSSHELFGPLTLGILGSFAAFLISGLTEWNFGDHEIITMVWFFTGLAIGAERIYNKSKF